jgi:hypothetical protein
MLFCNNHIMIQKGAFFREFFPQGGVSYRSSTVICQNSRLAQAGLAFLGASRNQAEARFRLRGAFSPTIHNFLEDFVGGHCLSDKSQMRGS